MAINYRRWNESDERIQRLSDTFPADKRGEADISVRVRMININNGRSPRLISACKPLHEYTWLVDRIRSHERDLPLEYAVDAALDEMPADFQIKPYLDANRVEVKTMLLTEYNEVETMQLFREEGHVQGRAEGLDILGALMTRLKLPGRIDDAFRTAADPVYRDRLLAEFNMG